MSNQEQELFEDIENEEEEEFEEEEEELEEEEDETDVSSEEAEESEETPEGLTEEQIEANKARIKELRAGNCRLLDTDFSESGVEGWEKFLSGYKAIIENEEKTIRMAFDDDDWVAEQLKDKLRSLHKANSPFSDFFPSTKSSKRKKRGATKKAQPRSNYLELNKFRELQAEVDKAFTRWLDSLPEYQAVVDYVSETLGIGEETTFLKGQKKDGSDDVRKVLDEFMGFAPYWRGTGAIKSYIEQNFKESKKGVDL